jgi:hypothetical protein
MNARTGTIAITSLVGIAAFLLTRVIWPDAEGGAQPTSTQLLLFILLGVTDSLLFGLGVAFAVYGLPLVRRLAPRSTVLAWLTYASIAFQLLSWWPHSNFHRVAGDNLDVLLAIDYGFHVPSQVGTLIIAVFFVASARGALHARRPEAAPSGAVPRAATA